MRLAHACEGIAMSKLFCIAFICYQSATERSLLQRQMSPMYQVNPLLSYGASHDMAGPGLNSHRVNGSQPQSHTEQRGRRSVVSPGELETPSQKYFADFWIRVCLFHC